MPVSGASIPIAPPFLALLLSWVISPSELLNGTTWGGGGWGEGPGDQGPEAHRTRWGVPWTMGLQKGGGGGTVGMEHLKPSLIHWGRSLLRARSGTLQTTGVTLAELIFFCHLLMRPSIFSF